MGKTANLPDQHKTEPYATIQAMADLLKGLGEVPRVETPVIPDETPLLDEEKALAAIPESKDTFLEEVVPIAEALPPKQEQAPVAAAPVASKPVTPAVKKDEATVAVEKVLEAGLGDFYATLPADAKLKFTKKGEEASVQISVMVRSLRLNVKKALQLIRDWLLTIPKVNKFFLEQEAKIKVDLLNQLIEERKQARDK